MKENVIITLKDICVAFDGETILNNLNLDIKDGEFVTILGPSGCGKTTTLRIIAGFQEPDSGEVIFDNQVMNGVPAHKRRVNTIFQRYALFPHLNVYENIAFGLRLKKMKEDAIQAKVKEMLALVDLKGFERRSIDSLSGGQQQRVAIARALAVDPEVLLLDEPLGALDLKLRKDMQVELKNIQQRLGITFIYVTRHLQRAGQRLRRRLHRRVQHPRRCHAVRLPCPLLRPRLRLRGQGLRPERARRRRHPSGRRGHLRAGRRHADRCHHVRHLQGPPDYSAEGETIGILIKPDEIHIMKKSKYSGEFGDYSSFSDEMDYISNAELDITDLDDITEVDEDE